MAEAGCFYSRTLRPHLTGLGGCLTTRPSGRGAQGRGLSDGSKVTNNMIGDFNIPLTGQDMLFQLSQCVPVQIGRRFLSKALLLLDRYAEADVDVWTDSNNAYLRPR